MTTRGPTKEFCDAVDKIHGKEWSGVSEEEIQERLGADPTVLQKIYDLSEGGYFSLLEPMIVRLSNEKPPEKRENFVYSAYDVFRSMDQYIGGELFTYSFFEYVFNKTEGMTRDHRGEFIRISHDIHQATLDIIAARFNDFGIIEQVKEAQSEARKVRPYAIFREDLQMGDSELRTIEGKLNPRYKPLVERNNDFRKIVYVKDPIETIAKRLSIIRA